MRPRTALCWLGVAIGVALAAFGVARFRPRESSHAAIPVPHDVNFARDVAPIIYAKCSCCHHPGAAAPFSLLTYDDARGRGSQIVDVVTKRLMPPWLPVGNYVDFADARILSDVEIETLRHWVNAGMPAGDVAQTPAVPSFADSWQTHPPDLVLETPPYALKSQDRDVFRNFVVPANLTAPRWVRSIEIRPLNPRVTHHARLGVDSSNESIRRDAEDDEPGYAGMAWGQDPEGQLVAWAPGMVVTPPMPGAAWRLYPKTTLVLHTHMQPSGKPETVQFRIGIRFANEPPSHQPAILRVGGCEIDIPAGERAHAVKDRYVLPVDVDVHSIFPHAHSLCRQIKVVAEKPDGWEQQLIRIDGFDENWHESYRYRQPLRLPRGTRLLTTFVYDNSDGNHRNRNRPARNVVYGSSVNDEMGDVYLQVTAAQPDQRAALLEDYKKYELKSQAAGHRTTLKLQPDNPWSQEALAAALVGLGEPAKAVEILEKRLKTGPREVFPLVSLGMAQLLSGNPGAAEQHLRLAIAMDPQYPLAWHGLGKALNTLKQPEPAEQAYRRSAELAPGFYESRLSLAELLIRRGQLDQAREVCIAARNDAPDVSGVHLKLAEIAAKRHDFAESFACCQTAYRLAPYTHPPKVLLAVFCCQNGDTERGTQLLREARAESPVHPMPPLMLGQLARQAKQGAAARELLAAAATLPPPENWPQSHKSRFLVLLHSERFQLAQLLQDVELARDALTQWILCEPDNKQLPQLFDQLPSRPLK